MKTEENMSILNYLIICQDYVKEDMLKRVNSDMKAFKIALTRIYETLHIVDMLYIKRYRSSNNELR